MIYFRKESIFHVYFLSLEKKEKETSLAMEGLDLLNVPEYDVFLAADLKRHIRTVCMLQVMDGEEVYLFYKF